MSESDAVQMLVDQWLKFAHADLNAGRTLSVNRATNSPETACFHAQQAAEKAIKALLVKVQIASMKGHDLSNLTKLLPTRFSNTRDLPSLAGLVPYAVAARYPVAHAGDPMQLDTGPTWDEADEALLLAERTVRAVEADLS
ncbi:MAG TPA: HEPN domain-containing protein [Candidatus Limnocylindrales bacterium]|jgi:HEPN domain-containing protein